MGPRKAGGYAKNVLPHDLGDAPGAAEGRAVAEALRACFGARLDRVVRVSYRRSYLIFAPGELDGWGNRLGEPDGRVHYAGAETSALPSFMEGAARAGERAAGEVLAGG